MPTTTAAAELAALLADPACPWEDPRRGPDGWRLVQVDRLLAFAFTRGADLRGLEARLDEAVRALGGRREPPSTGSELPYYRVPSSVASRHARRPR